MSPDLMEGWFRTDSTVVQSGRDLLWTCLRCLFLSVFDGGDDITQKLPGVSPHEEPVFQLSYGRGEDLRGGAASERSDGVTLEDGRL